MDSGWKTEIEALLAGEDYEGVVRLARGNAQKVLRYLSGRLYSADEGEKWRAVRAFEQVVGNREIVSQERAVELLRRFFWALNDESGAVPYGVPEAIGAVLAVRAELRPEYLPILQSMLHEEDMLQTGPIEQGVRWALEHVGV